MVHLRIVAPDDRSGQVVELLEASPAVQNVVHLHDAAQKPKGDLILCDVAREDASVILADLRELDIPTDGSIAMEEIDTSISEVARDAEKAARGLPSDAVIWEEVESRTAESTELSGSFLAFMVLATMIASVGLLLDQTVLVIGGMVVGPEFGPIAGACVAAVQRRRDLARRSVVALAVGFPVGILLTYLFMLAVKLSELGPADYAESRHQLSDFISQPDVLSVLVALLAGAAGVLSLSTTKSGPLIGVLISVTTIPAAANVAVAAAYSQGGDLVGALTQLLLNLSAIFLAGITTLYVQRRLYLARRRKHLRDPARTAAGLPERSLREKAPR